MAKIEINHPDKQVNTGAYSAGIEIDGWVYVSGQGPIDLKTGAVLRGTIEEEVRATLENVEKILNAAGCTLSDVVKCTSHLADINDFDRYNQAYLDYFGAHRPLPTRTTVQSGLGQGIKVEIDCVAKKPNR